MTRGATRMHALVKGLGIDKAVVAGHDIGLMPPGSVYSEPGGANHFARMGSEPVLVQLSGVGPTDTRYVDRATDPKAASR